MKALDTVWRFSLGAGLTRVTMPADAMPLFVGWQRESPQLWALVSPDAPMVQRAFYLAGTGTAVPEPILRHVGSMIAGDGFHVFHVFEVAP